MTHTGLWVPLGAVESMCGRATSPLPGERRYYIGLLSAAELHGAAHQRPQVFQVMVEQQVTDRDFGRVKLRFYSRAKLDRFPTVLPNSAKGQVRVATPETTALDPASLPQDAGGLNNVASVLSELVSDQRLTPSGLATSAPLYPRSTPPQPPSPNPSKRS